MKFRTAVACTQEIATSLRSGLDALSNAHRNSIIAPRSRKITGSVDIDAALQSAYPNNNRWDYAVGYYISNQDDKAFFIEFHRATVDEVSLVIQKKRWLESWMSGKPIDNLRPRRFVWVSAGGINIPKNSHQRRDINNNGLQLVRRLELD